MTTRNISLREPLPSTQEEIDEQRLRMIAELTKRCQAAGWQPGMFSRLIEEWPYGARCYTMVITAWP